MKAPRIPSMFKAGQSGPNKQFHYQPRTFDEQKEKHEKRRKEIENDVAYEARVSTDRKLETRKRISDSWLRNETRNQKKSANKRVLLILGALIILVYFMLFKIDFLG